MNMYSSVPCLETLIPDFLTSARDSPTQTSLTLALHESDPAKINRNITTLPDIVYQADRSAAGLRPWGGVDAEFQTLGVDIVGQDLVCPKIGYLGADHRGCLVLCASHHSC
jgi:hypothetical protein